MSDDLQRGINQACSYFYSRFDNVDQILDRINAKDTEIQLKVRDMSVVLMLGIGYLIGKKYLYYRGDQHYAVNVSGFGYYKSLLSNGDIVP